MVTNVGYEYVIAEEEYKKATTAAEKIAALQKMLTYVPKHEGTEKLQLQIKKRLADLKKEQKKEKAAGKGKGFAIRKEGAAQIVFLGTAHSDKSEFFNILSGINDRENPYEPKMRMIRFENIWLQGIELPIIYQGFSEAHGSGEFLSIMRNCDFIVLVVNGEDAKNQFEILQAELEKAKVNVQKIIVYTNQLANLKTNLEQIFYLDKDRILATIWIKLGKIRVQTRTRDKIAEKPIILEKESTVKELASRIHKDFLQKFKHAKIWGPSAAFPGQQVGFEHKLKDKDIIEIFLK